MTREMSGGGLCLHLGAPEDHVLVETVMTLYDQDSKELDRKSFDIEPSHPLPQECFTRYFLSTAPGRKRAKKFSICCHYDDGCVRDWEVNDH